MSLISSIGDRIIVFSQKFIDINHGHIILSETLSYKVIEDTGFQGRRRLG